MRAFLTLAALVGLSCTDSLAPPAPAALVGAVTNPLYILTPGTKYAFETQTAAGLETDTVEVLNATHMVNGVAATEVHDRVYVGGVLTEDTYDWFAQDSAGNVWYLGEDTKEYENGQVSTTAGSWEWGVNGAQAGIIMWANPAAHMGTAYRQEFEHGVAEDWAKVVGVDQSVTVPYGTLTGCVKTEEWNALEPAPHDHKYYCPQLGIVLEVAGDGERMELTTKTP